MDEIPFVATAPDEICRINTDGTTTYHWDRIEAAAQRWEPGRADIAVCLSKLLLPLRPSTQPRREWQGLTEEELDRWTPEIHSVIRAIEQALKERNNG
jgi:hypothetical protein